jgi:hypothetical protein
MQIQPIHRLLGSQKHGQLQLCVPPVTTMWAWCNSRSTVAVAKVLGMISSNPDGWRFELIARERRS